MVIIPLYTLLLAAMYYQNILKLKMLLKSPRFVPFGANLTQFGWQICPPWYSRHIDVIHELLLFDVLFNSPDLWLMSV